MKNEQLKEQLVLNAENIVQIISKGNTAEIKKNKDGIVIYEITRKKHTT